MILCQRRFFPACSGAIPHRSTSLEKFEHDQPKVREEHFGAQIMSSLLGRDFLGAMRLKIERRLRVRMLGQWARLIKRFIEALQVGGSSSTPPY